MGFNRFSALLALRLSFIMLCLACAGLLLTTPGYHAATLLVLAVTVALAYEVFRFVSRTNQELSRFLDAARYADFGQRFELDNLGAGFAELGATFTQILERFREDRNAQESELRHLQALLEHVPVPLVSVHSDAHLTLWNNSARRLFGIAKVYRLEDLAQFGADFSEKIRLIRPGERHLVSFDVDGLGQRLTLSASEITIGGESERLISLQNIQSELDSMQLRAWQDLVRVLTHEIMNSITPVASLAKTAADLVDDASAKVADRADVVDELKDAHDAVTTVARRSDGLMKFVSSYRQLAHLPAPAPGNFLLADLFAEVCRVTTQSWPALGIVLETAVEPPDLDASADRQMLEQVLINLLQNSEHALEGRAGAQVTLTARLSKLGRPSIEIADNGPGIPTDVVEKIFVPFFTTRREGSGVGLALSRQVMIAHGGSINFTNVRPHGARFTLVF